MHYSTPAALVAVLAAKEVSAGLSAGLSAGVSLGWDLGASLFSSPANCNNDKCTSGQQSGYNFGDLSPGPIPSGYQGCSWSGFTAAQVTLGKRGSKKRTSSNCITGSMGASSGPAFGYDAGFSLVGLQISADFDTDVECHYGMPSGETCIQNIKCGSSPNNYPNNQCGGATSVSFKQPSTATKSCGISVHSMSFDCSTSSATVPSPSPSTPTSSPSAYTTPNSSPATTTTAATSTSSTASTSSSASAVATSSPTAYTTETTPSPVSPSTYTQTITSTAVSVASATSVVTVTSISTYSLPGMAFPNATSTSLIYYTSTVAVPSTYTVVTTSVVVASATTVATSTALTTDTSLTTSTGSTLITQTASTTEVSTSTAHTTVSSSMSSPSPAPCGSLVQQCLNTWMWEAGCKDNADSSCYCSNSKFIADVLECIGCWGTDCAAKSQAVSYLAGICSSEISSNGFMFNIPMCATLAPTTSAATTTVTGTATAAPTATSSPAVTAVPATTITISSVSTCPATDSMGSTISGSSTLSTIQTTVTVPQVSFSTGSASTGSSVGLYPPTTSTAAAGAAPTTTGLPSSTSTSSPAATTSVQPFLGAATSKKITGGAVAFVAGAVAIFLF